MKIGVSGCGAVGSYYGAMLARKGHDVHFLPRSDYAVIKEHGVEIKSPKGDFHVFPQVARNPGEIGVCDLVLIGLKTTANAAFPNLLPPLVGPQTMVLTLQNGLGNEEQLARLFPGEQILGGLCFVCLNRMAPGVIRHMEHGLIVLGEFVGGPRPRTHALVETFVEAGVPCRASENLARAHWEKLSWNIPFNGLGVASALGYEAVAGGDFSREGKLGPCLTTDRLLTDPDWLRLVQELMTEVLRAATALGYPLPLATIDRQVEHTRAMGAYKPSTLVDFEHGLPLELDSLFVEPLRQARRAGVKVPRLEGLVQALTYLGTRSQPTSSGARCKPQTSP